MKPQILLSRLLIKVPKKREALLFKMHAMAIFVPSKIRSCAI